MLGLFNDTTGSIGDADWKLGTRASVIGDMLRQHAATATFGRRFAILKCAEEDKGQVLLLPASSRRRRKRSKRKKMDRLNINILFEDSLSRRHFYRVLPKTVSAFRQIVHDRSIPATVLDFEMVQSTASTTMLNLQRLFTAKK